MIHLGFYCVCAFVIFIFPVVASFLWVLFIYNTLVHAHCVRHHHCRRRHRWRFRCLLFLSFLNSKYAHKNAKCTYKGEKKEHWEEHTHQSSAATHRSIDLHTLHSHLKMYFFVCHVAWKCVCVCAMPVSWLITSIFTGVIEM